MATSCGDLCGAADAGAIVHTHPPSTTIACLRQDIRGPLHDRYHRVGSCCSYATFGTAELSAAWVHWG
jgi:ribulose-5-phosphate 4-epimerase/fuculose-1-phosphate aldolase